MFSFIFGILPAIIIPILHLEGVLQVNGIYQTFAWYILLFISYLLNVAHSETHSSSIAFKKASKFIISAGLVAQITLSFLYSFSTPFIFWEYTYQHEYMATFIIIFCLEYITRYWLILRS